MYAELHCLTNFSFLRAASHPGEFVATAAQLGYAAIAVTDRHSVAGVVRAHAAAKEFGLKLIVGAEIHPTDAPAVVLLATDRAAYGRLARLLTLGKARAPKGECFLHFDDLAAAGTGLLACIAGDPDSPPTVKQLGAYREAFGDRAYLLAEAHRGPNDAAWFAKLRHLSRHGKLPLVAAGGAYYHAPERRPLHDALTAVRLGKTMTECGLELFANAERHLHTLKEIRQRYQDLPGTIERTLEVAARCTFQLTELRYDYPVELSPPDVTPLDYLTALTQRGAIERYPLGISEKIRLQLEHELALIAELRYEAYFLTVWDLVRFARERQILCQGRGSAANSAVCYCLGVTSVDPSQTDLLFERFISRERNEVPDIDVDFEHERREEVLQYLFKKYGPERAAMTAEVIRYRSKSAAREIGKVLGFSPERIDAVAKTLVDFHRDPEAKWESCCRDGGLDLADRTTRLFLSLVQDLIGFPRHLSQHVGGMVMTESPLCELVPIENAAMPGRRVVEWNKDDLEELGMLKVDCLALGMLTAIRKCFDLVRRRHGRDYTLAGIPQDDPQVYDMICKADTIGVFQIESRAQMSMLPRLKPQSYYDLVIEVSIVRPGPIIGKMVHPYLQRRESNEEIQYPNDEIRQVLEKTKGVPIFQEQAMRLAVVAAGFTAGEADQLRRAMAAWKRDGAIEPFREKLLAGMQAQGLPEEFAARVYEQICGFGEYGFPESHAAGFALLVYVSAWLKKYYPAAFCAALCNSQPMGFYAPAQLIRDARDHGVTVLPIDVNHSDYNLTLERDPNHAQQLAVRLGLRLLRGMPKSAAERIVLARSKGTFRTLDELASRAQITRPILELLARGGVLGSLGLDRRAALWESLRKQPAADQPLFTAVAEEQGTLPATMSGLSPFEEVLADYRSQGMSLQAHPMSFLRPELVQRRCVTAHELEALPHGDEVHLAGIVLLRQRPETAHGITFVTLEDETGTANLILHPRVWQRYRNVARAARVWLVTGRLEKQGVVIHLVAERLQNLTPLLTTLRAPSRDFH